MNKFYQTAEQISSLFAGFRSSKFHFRPKLAQDWFKIDLIRSKLVKMTKNWSWDSRRGKIIRFYQLKPLALKTTSFRGKQTVQIWYRTVDFLATKFPKIFQILAKISPYDHNTGWKTKSNWFKLVQNRMKLFETSILTCSKISDQKLHFLTNFHDFEPRLSEIRYT